MKILVVGVFNENSTNNGIANGFENAGHEVVRYDYRKCAAEIGNEHRDAMVFSIVQADIYDLVFFCKCNGMSVDVVEGCSRYAKTFLWYMDPLNGNYNDELKEKIRVADYVGVAKWEVYENAKKLNPNTHFLIEGFDPRWDYPIESEAKYDITFIGNPYGDRAKWLNGVTILTNKFNTEHAKAVGESRININLTGGGGPSDRVYKILAAKGFCLSQSYPHVEKYGLVPDGDFVLFDTPEAMVDMCNYYLSHPDAAKSIAEHGHHTVQKFSRDNLAKEIVNIVSS
jgi:hypothetical protein